MMSFVFNSPTKLLFGAGKLGDLHLEQLPGKKALLLTSNGKSTRTNGSIELKYFIKVQGQIGLGFVKALSLHVL